MDPKGNSAEGRITEIPILLADNRPMFCFAIFFAIFHFFSFWQNQKFSELHKNALFRSNFLWTSENPQILKIANFFFVILYFSLYFFVENPEVHRPKADQGIRQILQNIKNTGKYQPKSNQIIFFVI